MSNPRQAILVAGGAGYIGGHVVRLLRRHGYPVVVLDNFVNSRRDQLATDVTLIEGSRGDKDLVAGILATHEPAAVIDVAGYPEIRKDGLTPLDFYANNVSETIQFLDLLATSGVDNYVFSSSAAVYGEAGNDPIAENHRREPLTAYGRAMRACEDAVSDILGAAGRRWLILRYFNVAGAMDDLSFGQTMPNAYHLIWAALNVVFGTVPRVNIYGNHFDTPDGTGIHDYIHVQDLADIHIQAVAKLRGPGAASDMVNCGYGHGWSVLEIRDAVARVTGTQVPINFGERRGHFNGMAVLDNRKLQQDWEWQPAFDDLDTIVRHSYDWRRQLDKQAG